MKPCVILGTAMRRPDMILERHLAATLAKVRRFACIFRLEAPRGDRNLPRSPTPM
jgi:hypothetical protein